MIGLFISVGLGLAGAVVIYVMLDLYLKQGGSNPNGM